MEGRPKAQGPGPRALQSDLAACLWIPSYALRCEEARRPELHGTPAAVLAPEDSRRIWQLSREARREGVKADMTVNQAIGLCPTLALIEPDPVHYDEQFAHLLMRLADVSPVIEPAELGRVYIGVDGLKRLVGGPVEQLAKIGESAVRRYGGAVGRSGGRAVRDGGAASSGVPEVPEHPQNDGAHGTPYRPTARPPYRLGWGQGKFIAWVAATRAAPGSPIVVPVGEERQFLAEQPLAVLPLSPDNIRRLRRLGLGTLGELAALPEPAVVAQFGREGRAAWRLAAGRALEPVEGREAPEPIRASLDFPTPVADRGMLEHTIGVLVEHALRDPRRTGWRVHGARVRATLEQGASWMTDVLLKDPSAMRERILAPLAAKLEASPPTGAVTALAVEFTAFARGTEELQLFARDAAAAARAGRRRALRGAAREMEQRLNQKLYRVIEVHPWSRLPERRYALIAFEP